mgnify:CR=1 FL=1|tara:strand:+ start:247 stop:1020 length:774 start_codon:yes stop_codon:yes gene_type:complete
MNMVAKRILAIGLASGLIATSGLSPASAQSDAGPMTAGQKAAFEKVVRDYILQNPEIISEAIERLRAKQRLAEAQANKETLVTNWAAIFEDADAPVGGNPKGDVTVVEFFDYRCGVCKRIQLVVRELVKTDRNIRRVYKEWPILGPASVLAARAAIASRKQGKYLPFHKAMMEATSDYSAPAIMAMAKSVGIDTGRLKKDMAAPEVDKIIRKNYALADKLGLNGTPSFVIGDTLLRGGRDLESLRAIVAEARAGKKK